MNKIAIDGQPPQRDPSPWIRELNRYLTPKIPAFHFRHWDTEAIFDVLDARQGHVILEFGAWNLMACIPYLHIAGHFNVTDSFQWAKNDLFNGPYYITREEWLEMMGKLPGIHAWDLDIQDLNTTENYDRIYSVSVIEHVPDDVKALTNIYRALKPGGVFAFTTDINLLTSSPYIGHCRVYTLNEILSKVLRVGFKIDQQIVIESDLTKLLEAPHYNLCLRCVKPI